MICVVFSVSSAFAQATGSVQTGFVAITPVVGFGQGLIVFGRFANRNGDQVVQSTGWAGSVLTSSALVVSSDGSSSQNSGIAIVNPSNSAAGITLTLRNNQGSIVASRTITLGALRQISQFVTEIFNLGPNANVAGLLTISSTVPIAILGFQFNGAFFSVLPTNVPIGETALLLPQFASGAGWSTDIVIANTTPAAQTVRVDVYNPVGGILATSPNVNILPGAFTVLPLPGLAMDR